jgi:hypothetical protein
MERPGPVEQLGGSPNAETVRRALSDTVEREPDPAFRRACEKIDRRCFFLHGLGKSKRIVAGLDRRDPILMRHREFKDSEIQLHRLDGERGWSIRLMREEGFPLWGTASGFEDGRPHYQRLTFARVRRIDADVIYDGDEYRLDGGLTLIPEPDSEELFCHDFGVPEGSYEPYHRLPLADYALAGAGLVQDGIHRVSRVR